jgi:glycosyltransferase involved in cell wall biosynthesis
MKILHVTKKYPPALGGDAVVVANLQKQQRLGGHKVVIVTSNCDEIDDAENIYKFGLPDTPENLDKITPRRMLSLIMLFFKMFPILRRERPDVIHTHSVDMAFFVSFAARFYNIPVVHTFHIVTFYDTNQSALRRKTEVWLAQKAGLRHVTAPNTYDVKKLQAAGLGQAVLLPNGVDLNFWRSAPPTTPNSTFTFLAVGRLEQQKGYEYLIKATFLLTNILPAKFRVIVVGEGSQKAALYNLAQTLHVDDIITFAGRKSPEEVRTLLAAADAAVFPSLYETTPLTLLEAWSAAVPVIVTEVGIVRETPAGFDAAYIVPPKDEHALMQAMSRCMTDTIPRQNIAAKGNEEAKKYAWPLIARTAESIYRSTL